jgi:hypothetical protein
MDAATLATLAADIVQLRDAVRVLAEGQQDAVAALADLDKHQAVGDAKSDLRAEDLKEVKRLVDKIAQDVAPAALYFTATNAARVSAEANKANAWSYFTRERIVMVIALFGALLTRFFPITIPATSGPVPEQSVEHSDTVTP